MRRVQLGGMFIRVMFHGFFGVPDGMHCMAVSDVRMVAGLDMVAVIVVARSFAMMLGRVVVMFGGFQMVFNALVLRHVVLSSVAMLRAAKYRAVRSQ
jgi:hypothetical protein